MYHGSSHRRRLAAFALLVTLTGLLAPCYLHPGRSDDELTAKIGWDYQPEKIEEYFREKPWQLAEHGAAIVQALLGLAASTAILLIQGQAWAQIRLKLAPEVRRSLCQLGPSYIKLGQALASRPDLVGGELAEELVQLQDSLPAFDTKDALEVIKQEFQGAQDPAAAQELLKSLEGAVPKAAASLGQVYQGVLRGRSVAVKVQRPEARRLAAVDAALLRSLARGVEALRNPLDGQRLVRANVLGAVDEFCSRLFEELDYRREASNCATFAALYGDHGNYASDLPPPGLKIPELEPDFCGRRVLVMEWVEGERLAPSADAKEDLPLVEMGISATLLQLLGTGVMHTDPHGGNLLK
ncbi:Uncharacterized protein sll0005, partial [Durusdinium trenchii]